MTLVARPEVATGRGSPSHNVRITKAPPILSRTPAGDPLFDASFAEDKRRATTNGSEFPLSATFQSDRMPWFHVRCAAHLAQLRGTTW